MNLKLCTENMFFLYAMPAKVIKVSDRELGGRNTCLKVNI